jgi:hypothetical protein
MDEKILAQMMDQGEYLGNQEWTTHREHLLLVKVNGNHHFIAYSATKLKCGAWIYKDGHGNLVHRQLSISATYAAKLIPWF